MTILPNYPDKHKSEVPPKSFCLTFAKYALRKAGITRNVLIDKEGRIVKLTRLYNPEEFASLVKEIDGMLSE